jgi:hypothetical protein
MCAVSHWQKSTCCFMDMLAGSAPWILRIANVFYKGFCYLPNDPGTMSVGDPRCNVWRSSASY